MNQSFLKCFSYSLVTAIQTFSSFKRIVRPETQSKLSTAYSI